MSPDPRAGGVKSVISEGFCIGCGACTLGQKESPIRITLDNFGKFQAKIIDNKGADDLEVSNAVCPFSGTSLNENEIARELFNETEMSEDSRIGHFIELHAGHVVSEDFRSRGSSGGFTSWILAELLRRKMVDGIIHAKPRKPDSIDKTVLRYGVSTSVEDLKKGSKSHYYPVELSGVLQYIRNNPGRYAVVGVPCFIKAIRLLARKDPIFRDRVVFCVGLFCGHLKSAAFAEFLGWQCGIEPDHLEEIDFRVKLPGRSAADYAVKVRGDVSGNTISRTAAMSELLGSDWGMGFFKYQSCDFCDDISAETADVSIGDAWLPQFTEDSEGTNIIIVRNKVMQAIVEDGERKGALRLSPLTAQNVVDSQIANYRHRREELPYRLYLRHSAGEWYPRKRLNPERLADIQREEIQDCRIRFRDKLPDLWRHACSSGNYNKFLTEVNLLIEQYYARYKVKPRQSISARLKRKLKLILKGWRRLQTP